MIGSYDLTYGAFVTNVFGDVYTELPSPKHCTASAINDLGAITGTCDGLYQAFVLSPNQTNQTAVSEPASIDILFCSLLLGAVGRWKLRIRFV